jgi:hypothetical protein
MNPPPQVHVSVIQPYITEKFFLFQTCISPNTNLKKYPLALIQSKGEYQNKSSFIW